MEFFLFPLDESGKAVIKSKSKSKGNGTYFSSRPSIEHGVRQTIVSALTKMGYQVEAGHDEVAEHQHEIDLRYSEALKMADLATTFKLVARKIAADFGYHVSFMPKPIASVNGSGMHVHQSLFKKTKMHFIALMA